MPSAATDVRELVRIVVDDPGLPRRVRRDAAALMELASSQPRLARRRLEDLRLSVLPDLPLVAPAVDYARCISVETFWRFHVRWDRKAMFGQGSEAYRRHLESQSDPANIAHQDLSPEPVLFPAAHSWLIPATNLEGANGPTLRRRLELGESRPPYVVFFFPRPRLRAAGVEIREPRGIDALPGPQLQWTPEGVPDERIDRDVPLAALGWIEWRP